MEYFEQHPLVDPADLGRAVVAGTDWASIDAGDAVFTPGERVTVTVSGLQAGQQIIGTLYSTPVNLGTFVANSAGVAAFVAVIPANTPVGAHSLVISSLGLQPISLPVTVVAGAGAVTGAVAVAGTTSTSGLSAIPALGASLVPAVVGGLLLLLGGGALLFGRKSEARRKREALPA
jgi:5'-nucleotidase